MRGKKSSRRVRYTAVLCVVTQRSSLLVPRYLPTQRTALEQTMYPKATILRKKRGSSYQWKYFVSVSSNKKHTSEFKRGLPSKQCWAIYIADRVAHALKFDEKCSIIDPVKSFSFFSITKKGMLWKCIKKVFIRTRTRKELYISLFWKKKTRSNLWSSARLDYTLVLSERSSSGIPFTSRFSFSSSLSTSPSSSGVTYL